MLYRVWYRNIVSKMPENLVEKGGGPFFSLASLLVRKPKPIPIDIQGLRFPYPVGMPSGWVDDVTKLQTAIRLGVGIPIIKTITRKPRVGNPRPRVIRLSDGLINSLGLPNKGMDWWLQKLERIKSNIPLIASLKGENIGEWQEMIDAFDTKVSLMELNFSCPNTEEGVMDIQESVKIIESIAGLSDKIWIKLSPEYSPSENLQFIKKVRSNIRGVTLINTVPISDERLGNPRKTGGLSGEPIFLTLKQHLRKFRKEFPTFSDLPIFATGGIHPKTAPSILKEFRAVPFMLTSFLMNGPKTYVSAIQEIKSQLDVEEINELLE